MEGMSEYSQLHDISHFDENLEINSSPISQAYAQGYCSFESYVYSRGNNFVSLVISDTIGLHKID